MEQIKDYVASVQESDTNYPMDIEDEFFNALCEAIFDDEPEYDEHGWLV